MLTTIKNSLKKIAVVRDAKSAWQNFWINFSMQRFNNHLGIGLNAQYAFHHLYCRLRTKLDGTKPDLRRGERDQFLIDNGFAIFPAKPERAALIQEIEAEMSRLYADPSTHNPRVTDPSFVQITDVLKRVPQITKLLDNDICQIAERYFGSHFKIFRVSMYRTRPKPEEYEKLKNAWRWHTDSYPNEVIKIMFYLTDTDRHSGAFRVHPRASSRDFIKKGFGDRYKVDHLLPELENPARYQWAEGPAGTVVFFDDNLVHRATPPEAPHYRDVVVFEIMPHSEPWHKHFARTGSLLSSMERQSMKWHTNPFTD